MSDPVTIANLLNSLIEEAPDLAETLHKTLFVTHSPNVVDSKVDFIQIAEHTYATNIIGIMSGLVENGRLVPVMHDGRVAGFSVKQDKEER